MFSMPNWFYKVWSIKHSQREHKLGFSTNPWFEYLVLWICWNYKFMFSFWQIDSRPIAAVLIGWWDYAQCHKLADRDCTVQTNQAQILKNQTNLEPGFFRLPHVTISGTFSLKMYLISGIFSLQNWKNA